MRRVDVTQLYDLRRRVLRNNDPESRVIDPRDDEESSLHFAGQLNDRVVAAASLYPSTAPVNPELLTYQLRFMAVDLDVHGRGYGSSTLRAVEQELQARGVQQIWANARDSALGFYRALGWLVVAGSEHVSNETMLAHTAIFKVLTNSQ